MLFAPYAAGTTDIAATAANLAWWQAALPVVTHVAGVPALRLAWRLELYFFAAVLFYGGLASSVYHLCLSWHVTCFGLPLEASRLSDYIWAMYLLVAQWLLLLRLYSHAWASFVSLGALAVLIFAAIAAPFSFSVLLFVLYSMLLLLFIKAVLIDGILVGRRVETAFDAAYRFSEHHLIVGVVLQGAAVAVYFIDGPAWYWLAHSVWHLFGYVGIFFFVMGITKDLQRWPGAIGWNDVHDKMDPPLRAEYERGDAATNPGTDAGGGVRARAIGQLAFAPSPAPPAAAVL